FARCFVDEAGNAERQHLNECPECRAALDRFDGTIASFRTAIRERVDSQLNSPIRPVPQTPPRPAAFVNGAMLRWGFIAASVLMFVMVPFIAREQKVQTVIPQTTTATDADALMKAVNRHISRTMPAPMEPIIALLPSDEPATKSGGVQ